MGCAWRLGQGPTAVVPCCPSQEIIRLKHAHDHSSILELPEYSCAAKIMHQTPDTKATEDAQEAPPGSYTR